MKKLTDSILRGDSYSQEMITRMVREIEEYIKNQPEEEDEDQNEDDSKIAGNNEDDEEDEEVIAEKKRLAE
jgi:hypothetical protein